MGAAAAAGAERTGELWKDKNTFKSIRQGRRCSSAVERTPHNQEVVGAGLVSSSAIFSYFPSPVDSLTVCREREKWAWATQAQKPQIGLKKVNKTIQTNVTAIQALSDVRWQALSQMEDGLVYPVEKISFSMEM